MCPSHLQAWSFSAAKGITIVAAAAVISGCAPMLPPQPCWNPPPASTWDHPLGFNEALALALESDVSAADWCAREKAAQAELVSAQVLPNPVLGRTWEDIGLKDAAGKSLLLTQTD